MSGFGKVYETGGPCKFRLALYVSGHKLFVFGGKLGIVAKRVGLCQCSRSGGGAAPPECLYGLDTEDKTYT